MWESPPVEAMDPQQGAKNIPTSKQCLDLIPRITIDSHSAILHEATVDIQRINKQNTSETASFDATVGEFPPHPPFKLTGDIILCQPNVRGKLPISSTSLKNMETSDASPILFMERGDITFVQKSQNARSVGAKAVICANHVPVWPYVMKDSANRAKDDDIPIVMVKRSDGRTIRNFISSKKENTFVTCNIRAERIKNNNCIICTEGFDVGGVVMRLPLCGHVFHEQCALSWLTKHNTCPYCRRELPAEDKEYEKERRRLGRSHASPTDSNESQWEVIFG